VASLEFVLTTSTRVPASAYQKSDLARLARFVLDAEKVREPVELSVDLTNDSQIQRLNRHFRGVDRTTDVISFRGDIELPKNASLGGFTGDLAINVHQAARQAKKVKNTLKRELRLLLVHGILHLLGYTDYEPRPRRRMFQRQNRLLRRWEQKK
jgi:probable rRNA maturation factor